MKEDKVKVSLTDILYPYSLTMNAPTKKCSTQTDRLTYKNKKMRIKFIDDAKRHVAVGAEGVGHELQDVGVRIFVHCLKNQA